MVQFKYDNLEDFGDVLMVDGKAIQSFATLIADAKYEIPVSFRVTKASASEKTETQKLLEGWGRDAPAFGYAAGV